MSTDPLTVCNFCRSASTAHCAYDYAQVDVFAERPLEGNALAVFTDARGLSTEEMQALARETNLSETTFILPRDSRGRARARRPGPHLHRAGRAPVRRPSHARHRKLALLESSRPARRRTDHARSPRRPHPCALQAAAAGRARRLRHDAARTIPPSANAFTIAAAIAAALGLSVDDLDPDLPAQTVSTGMPFCIVPLRSLEVAARLAIPQPAARGLSRSQRRKILPLHHARCCRLQAPTGTRACSSTTEKIPPPARPPAAPSPISCVTALAASGQTDRHRTGSRDAPSQPHSRPVQRIDRRQSSQKCSSGAAPFLLQADAFSCRDALDFNRHAS